MKLHKDHKDKSTSAQNLYEALALVKTSDEAKKFLEDLCTPAELQAMADRWEVVPYLKNEIPYQQIYDKTGVSVTTIGRVARCLRFGSGGYDIIYKRLGK